MGCPFGAQGDAAKGKPDGERKSFYRLAVFPNREIAGRVPADLFPQGGYATAKGVQQEGFPRQQMGRFRHRIQRPCGVFQQMAVAVGQGGGEGQFPKVGKGKGTFFGGELPFRDNPQQDAIFYHQGALFYDAKRPRCDNFIGADHIRFPHGATSR